MILVLGAGGLLGRHLTTLLQRQERPFVAHTRETLDITDANRMRELLDSETFTSVINCAALCSFGACETNPDASARVNRDAPIRWAAECAARGIRFVHFSSDYIFDGRRDTPYPEEAEPHPLSVYAKHKAETEPQVLSHPMHLLLRVAWIFGAGGRTFMSMLPRLLMESPVVTVASGKRGSCLYAGHGAEMILELVDRGATGLLHVVNSGEATWEGYAHSCLQKLRARNLRPLCNEIREHPFDSMPNLQGFRPPYSVLSTAKLAGILGKEPPHWEAGLDAFLDDLFRVK
jgi:dTDP-4-dehydrorhamnose reductase